MSTELTPPHTVELWIRSFTPGATGPAQDRALEYLDELQSCPAVDAIEVGVWGNELERSEWSRRLPQLRRIETRLEAFEAWAARTGRLLQPWFRPARIESSITGEARDVWRLPAVALAEFDEDDTLRHVTPCREGDRIVTVVDRLETLVRAGDTDGEVDDCRPDEVTADRPPTHRIDDPGTTSPHSQ